MRLSFLLLFLCGCPAEDKPVTHDTGASDTAPPAETDTAEVGDSADTVDTSEPPCEGIRLVQSVTYAEDAEPYDLAAVPGGFAVSLPTEGEGGTVDVWLLGQGEAIDAEKTSPAHSVIGPGIRQFLGVQMWMAGTDLCSQTYGTSTAGTLYCWPWASSGEVSTVATTIEDGVTEGGYFGYGFTAEWGEGVTYAFDAAPPGAVTSGGASLWEGACEDNSYCHQGARIGDVIATVSDNNGTVYGHDAYTGALLWTVDTGGTTQAPSYVWAAHDAVFVATSPSSSTPTVAIDPTTGTITFAGLYYTAGYAEGRTSASNKKIEVLAYYDDMGDDSFGGIQVWDAANNETTLSLASALGFETPSDWDEPYIRLVALDTTGYFAFLTRRGRYAGVVEVCSIPPAT